MKNLLPETMDTLFTRCHLAAMAGGRLSVIEKGALAVSGEKIAWVGKEKDLPQDYGSRCKTMVDCQNRWLLPGFVDCHTHLVWAGSRSHEFEMRVRGVGYEEIAKQGGGILSTVRATRAASREDLLRLASKRVKTLIRRGITTLEIKSGYGLDLETELKLLDVMGDLAKAFPLHIEPTFLGAHALPPEFQGSPDGYTDLIIRTMLPKVKTQGIATAVDVFCERMAFSLEDTRKIFEAATALGLRVKLHAEQFSDSHGAALASSFNALSCDHLEYLSPVGAEKMARHKVTAVLLPGAFYYLKEKQRPPIQTLRDLKTPMALATDLNPGSSPVFSMALILNMACLLFGLTCEEALLGATLNGAKALGLDRAKGSLEPGKDADLVVWDIDEPSDLCCFTGLDPVGRVMIKGRFIDLDT
ncbi:MAG: imidazolonepropionase [Desulfobacula sp. RIFOXYA12_FULL_46_16]|nr:MAG: imidazolonepropionase [Desulfobacula sp. RIFOXYA12_FULL_46_16]